jgi:hypothetical protein
MKVQTQNTDFLENGFNDLDQISLTLENTALNDAVYSTYLRSDYIQPKEFFLLTRRGDMRNFVRRILLHFIELGPDLSRV